MRSLWMTFALAAFPACSAIACAPGEWLQQGAGWEMCVPMPGMSGNNQQPVTSTPVWADRWGAIAVDKSNVAAGIGSASGMKRKGQAERAALKDCQNKGIARCKVKLAYYSQCAALVWGDHSSSINSAPSKEQAIQIGMDRCFQAKDTNCEVYFSDCSFPERIR
ncbi:MULTISPECIES: DUF4189 domain-containing protein [unclassified Lysobacter]|uniref:DUF4189 domain-containing protein n=1 Tax=unclassified Lysobacter TaxID=2635362 RepID=UPI001BEC4522|nr:MULTISPECIES: DUF4189 domain-containing protein [unclassified Lysobacter]MBT2746926.1 DUF4189 domain-containing protein [Lysobacter sp. ISL-42]MBT2750613.1 DUF4189 domain-containing protein [Lysobacter sp. ISL-50]MBT2776459.1 DUF4189 domain-containing protein [Lysobacter sp. ISL-54]MBT2780954.1 DUF4189 domain-containing protein [Lysobacter sp. ISL-52]